MLRYSASAKDRATVLCFLVLQLTNVEPRKTQNPVRDFLVSGHEAQPASQYTTGCKALLTRKNNPLEGLPFKYLWLRPSALDKMRQQIGLAAEHHT